MSTEHDPARSETKCPEAQPVASAPSPGQAPVATLPKRWSRRQRAAVIVAGFVLIWAVVAYLVMPPLWKRYVRRHPALSDIPGITHTKTGVPGDPLNVALIGTEEQVAKIMVAAGWHPADPLTFRSSAKIVGATVLRRPYVDAPVSDLFLWGRKQDLAFEQSTLKAFTPANQASHLTGPA